MSKKTYDLQDMEIFCARAAQAAIEAALQAIDDEPELPGDPPQEMVDALVKAVRDTDTQLLAETLRIVVRLTKSGIKERLLAASPQCELDQ